MESYQKAYLHAANSHVRGDQSWSYNLIYYYRQRISMCNFQTLNMPLQIESMMDEWISY